MANDSLDKKSQDVLIRKYSDLIRYENKSPHWTELMAVVRGLSKMEHYEKCQELMDLINGPKS
jgi:hypothetical protein